MITALFKKLFGTKQNKHALATALLDAGFLKYADIKHMDLLSAEITDSFYIYNVDNIKYAHIDAEELAEFSFDMFLPTLKLILNKRNIHLDVYKLNDEDYSFDIVINDRTIQLYTEADMDNGSFWRKAASNFFRSINNMLQSLKCEEKFYLLYQGNDLSAILLTEEEFKIIADYYQHQPGETPYSP